VELIDFTGIDFEKKSSYFRMYVNPFEKIPAVGRDLEAICLKYVFDLLKLEVFEDNTQVGNLYKKFNFKEIGMKSTNKKTIICMELEK